MQNVFVTGIRALMGWTGLRLGIVILALLGYGDSALAISNCTPFTPSANLAVLPTSTTYPGGATINASAELPTSGQCASTVTGVSLYVNGAVVTTTSSGSINSYALSNLSPGTYSIYAHATYSTGSASSTTYTLTVTAASQAITIATIPSQTYGSAVALSATSTSGLAVTAFSSATTSVCTVSGSTATMVGTGTCTIDAIQTGTPITAQHQRLRNHLL
jgi:hypothetical protein